MGFWLLVPGVLMGGAGSEPTGRWEYAAAYAPWEFAVPLSIEYAADGLVEHAVEAP